MSDTINLAKIRAMVKAATPGPWDTSTGMVRSKLSQTASVGAMSITTTRYPVAECARLGPEHPVSEDTANANAALIAAAPETIAALVAWCEEAETIIGHLIAEAKCLGRDLQEIEDYARERPTTLLDDEIIKDARALLAQLKPTSEDSDD